MPWAISRCPRPVVQDDACASGSEPPAAGHTAPVNCADESRDDADSVRCAEPTACAGRKAATKGVRIAALVRERHGAGWVRHDSFHLLRVSYLDCKAMPELLGPPPA